MHGPGRRPSRAASRPPQDDGSLVPNRCAVRQISNVHVSRCFYICAGALFAASHGRQLMRCTGRPENALTPPPVMTKPHFCVEADGAGIVGIDVELESGRRNTLCFRDQRAADARTPKLRRHHELVEIMRGRIDGDETDHRRGHPSSARSRSRPRPSARCASARATSRAARRNRTADRSPARSSATARSRHPRRVADKAAT